VFESGFDVMDQMIAATRRELAAFPGTPLDYLKHSMEVFSQEAARQPQGAGAKHMALSLFLLARQQEVIERLLSDLSMRDYALNVLFELNEL
jgi:hypothetical protein